MKALNRALNIFSSALPLIMLCICSGEIAVYVACAVVLHECAHLVALKLFHGRIKKFRVAPFGFCIDYDASTLSLLGELAVSSAGCFVNLTVSVTSLVLYRVFSLDFIIFGAVNVALGAVNLLPVYPLDGYKMLFVCLSMIFGPFIAERIANFFGYISALAIFLVSSYLLLTSVWGVYPLLFSVYIFSSNVKNRQGSADF